VSNPKGKGKWFNKTVPFRGVVCREKTVKRGTKKRTNIPGHNKPPKRLGRPPEALGEKGGARFRQRKNQKRREQKTRTKGTMKTVKKKKGGGKVG